MKIGLACYECRNNDIDFNISQIEKAIISCTGTTDLLCFAEAFLQGFDSLSWNYDEDRHVAVSTDSLYFDQLKEMSRKYQIDLALGYMEKADEAIYSSYAVIIDGEVAYNYRRITKNWKEYTKTDEHYKEGTDILTFPYKEKKFTVGLCGDLWIIPERFRTDCILLWPIYSNFTLDAWRKEEQYAYAEQASDVAKNTMLVSSITTDPKSVGGAMYFQNGEIRKKLEFGVEDVLIIEI